MIIIISAGVPTIRGKLGRDIDGIQRFKRPAVATKDGKSVQKNVENSLMKNKSGVPITAHNTGNGFYWLRIRRVYSKPSVFLKIINYSMIKN